MNHLLAFSALVLLAWSMQAPPAPQDESDAQPKPDAELQDRYLKQPAPSRSPTLFAPGVVSTEDEHEFGSVFSADGLEFFYGVSLGDRTETRSIVFEDGAWGVPRVVLSHPVYGFNDPFLSPDEERLYVISDSPHSGSGPKRDHDIWYATRGEGGWSDPVPAGPSINSDGEDYYISFTSGGDLYFGSNRESDNFDLYVARYVDGEHRPAQRLEGAVNTPDYEADVFVAPDESYLIFCGRRAEGLGAGDLYISFRAPDGTWSAAQNMGQPINSPHHELCPFVTADGKYLFYTSAGDIYWADAALIDDFR